jgi:hypothetical protein
MGEGARRAGEGAFLSTFDCLVNPGIVKAALLQHTLLPVAITNTNSPKHMNTCCKAITLALLALCSLNPARAADESVTGKWKGQFDSQIGIQKYTFEFKVEGDKLTGKAIGEREMGTNDVKIVDGKINKDQISFVEPLKFDDNEVKIEYTGKISGDEIKFHRKVGEFAEEDFVAKRVKEDAKTPELKPDAKSQTDAAPEKAPTKK